MSVNYPQLLDNFIIHPGVEVEVAQQAFTALNFVPPEDYLAALQFTNGGEGFIGLSYFRLYSLDEVFALNAAYQVVRFAPGLILFGSTGGGEAFAFDTRQTPIEIVKVPFIPLDLGFAERVGKSFAEFVASFATAEMDDDNPVSQEINLSAVGKEVHEIQPIIFGGDPVDHNNKALVPSEKHAEFCVFWNGVYRRMKAEQDHA